MDKKFKKFVDFLKVIDSGCEIKIGDQTYMGGYTDDDELIIGMKVFQYNSTDGEEKGEDVLLQPPLAQEMNSMINFVDKNLDDAELESVMLNVALNASIKGANRST